jgi:hypothetical protein
MISAARIAVAASNLNSCLLHFELEKFLYFGSASKSYPNRILYAFARKNCCSFASAKILSKSKIEISHFSLYFSRLTA